MPEVWGDVAETGIRASLSGIKLIMLPSVSGPSRD
jgi:hypothetical protein